MSYRRIGGYVQGVFLVGAVGLAIAACGDDGPEGSGGQAGAGGEASSLSEQYASAYCGKIAECCDYNELGDTTLAVGVGTYAGCRIAYRTVWEAYFEHLLDESSKAGRLDFNEGEFAGCMDAVKAMSCADYDKNRGADVPACKAMFVAKVALGGACISTIECIEGDCEVPNGAAEGTCITLPGEGEPCLDGSCGDGVRCENQVCVPLLADGAVCESNGDCESSACKKEPMSATGTCVRLCDGGGPGIGR